MNAVQSEAELRGIDMEALMEESFTSKTHLAMVARHEMKVRMIYKEIYRPVKKTKTYVNPGIRVDVVNEVSQFTKKQSRFINRRANT